VLDEGAPVNASDGAVIGTVDHVISAPAEDIFHGIIIRVGTAQRFVAADQIVSLHERGVDLRIDAAAAAMLPEPHGAAPAWRVHEPGVMPSRWTHIRDPADRRGSNTGWTEEN
jgi:hypothetical protein